MANSGIKDETSGGEAERLRAENEALKQRLEEVERRPKKKGGWRGFVVWVLIVLACFFSFSGVLSVWVKQTTLDTNTFVGTIAPIVQNPEVADAVSTEAVNALWKNYDIDNQVKQAVQQLPPKLDFIAGPVSSGLKTAAQKITDTILKSDQFQAVWKKILTVTHQTAVNLI